MSYIFLDNQATTPAAPEVISALCDAMREHVANPSSAHRWGRRARAAADEATQRVAVLIGGDREDLVITSGATEANNLAISGLRGSDGADRGHVVTVETEHKSVLESVSELERRGWEVTRIPPSPSGLVDPGRLRDAVRGRTKLVSVMLVNNETGVLQPIAELARAVRECNEGVLVHTDGTQAVGKIPLDVQSLDVDLLSASAHKFYGPRGVGFLWVRKGVRRALRPVLVGGSQQGGLRAGTVNVPGLVGMGVASVLAAESIRWGEERRIAALTTRLLEGLKREVGEVLINAREAPRIAGALNICIPDVDAEMLVANLSTVAISTGSACASGAPGPSHVLRAMGLADKHATSSVRLSVGRYNTIAEVEQAASRIGQAVRRIRRLSAD